MAAKVFSFTQTISKLRSTERGKEAAMYGPLRDLFLNLLGYPAGDVDIDVTGDGGRPDVTVRAPSGLVDAKGNATKIAWIVVEAKDESVFSDPESREEVYAKKAKYIGSNTGWFVMADPTILVARQVGGKTQSADLILPLTDTVAEEDFHFTFDSLRRDLAGVPEQLKRFREGDQDLIASQKLEPPAADAPTSVWSRYYVSRKRFYANLRDATQHLQDACRHTLLGLGPEIDSIRTAYDEFTQKYGGMEACSFDSRTLMVKGSPQGTDQSRRHDRDARALRRHFLKEPHVVRLALEGLPFFQSRTGADDDKVADLFAVETANLILARVLLLRFFEDNGFFGEQRYICNGGVEAFQKMSSYFAFGYTQLLEQAYRQASRLYAAAFDETELDWVFGSNDISLSRAIEWALFQFSRYDFTTIKGDLLTGVYDRFMDRAKRKELGEFYTPPSIARYIIRRIGIKPGDKVLDPATGSGTFLIEAYQELVGRDVDRGIADYNDVVTTLSNLCGNDINTFSAILCQIQLLWHILKFKADIQHDGFPDLPIASKSNSLIVPDQFSTLERFGELDVQEYSAVIGNPPYVRKERSAQDLDKQTVAQFEHESNGFPGVSAKMNAYALFIYRALSSWTRAGGDGQPPGKLGFIVPVSLFDSNETDALRRLFRLGARWTVLEIIDLELIYKHVFDADVLPAIIICENRPATESDAISVRIASKDCVVGADEGAAPEFDFESIAEEQVPYTDIFTPDGRIMTRLTKKRAAVLRRFHAAKTFDDIAKPYWVRKQASKVIEWSEGPVAGDPRWEERKLISRGIVFRSTRPASDGVSGHDIYKGENIIAAEIQGEPAVRGCDPAKADAPYIWQYASVLPDYAYAVAQMAHCPNAVKFNPTRIAFTDTATIFIPDQRASQVPFDLLLLSDIYVWFYALAARMGVLRTCRSHIYPTNVAFLPWTEDLISKASEIEGLRARIVKSCVDAADASEALIRELDALGYLTLKERLRADLSSRIDFGANFDASGYAAEISAPRVSSVNAEGTTLRISEDVLDAVEISRADLVSGLLKALQVREGLELNRAEILGLSVPLGDEQIAIWDEVSDKNSAKALVDQQYETIHELNKCIAGAFQLSDEDLHFIETECREDSFLKRIKPRYPGSVTRKQGFRAGLDASSRYGL